MVTGRGDADGGDLYRSQFHRHVHGKSTFTFLHVLIEFSPNIYVHRFGNVGIVVQLLMEINLEWLPAEEILMKTYICHGALI